MNKIVWVMGQSAAGKETFIKYAAANPDGELVRKLGYANSKIVPIEESLYGDERTKIINDVLELLNTETNAVMLIKWQNMDNDEHYDVIRKLNASTSDVPNEMIMLSVESDVLYARLPNKWWWNENEAANFSQEKMNNLVNVLRNNIIRWQSLGLTFTAEIEATDGYKIIENSLLKKQENKKGKVILLGGCPRTGKTTLSVKLVKSSNAFSKISGDYLGEAFGENRETGKINNGSAELVERLLEGLLRDAEVYGINSVFEYCSYDFSPEDLEKSPFKDELEIYFFGFPNISEDEIRYNIKYYAKPSDWIYHCDDAYISEVAKRIYAHNIELKNQCEKYGYRFIDTGVGKERDIILNSLYEKITADCPE
jgi:predicted kinase